LPQKGFILLLIILIPFSNCLGQVEDSVLTETPFRKGRWIIELNGMINSGTVIRPDSIQSDSKFANNYSFTINIHKLIANRIALGLLIGTSRTSNEEFFIQESELFSIGPSFRYFLSNSKEGGAYVQTSVFYNRFYDRSAFIDIQNPVDVVLKGKGIGTAFGLGYAYVLKDLLILEIGFNYSYSWLSGENINQITNVSNDENFKRSSFSFSFGLAILLGK
jgi:hypothetical protein